VHVRSYIRTFLLLPLPSWPYPAAWRYRLASDLPPKPTGREPAGARGEKGMQTTRPAWENSRPRPPPKTPAAATESPPPWETSRRMLGKKRNQVGGGGRIAWQGYWVVGVSGSGAWRGKRVPRV
jgi:hypothetical protein